MAEPRQTAAAEASPAPYAPDYPVAEAARVFLVVHGVGDHSPVDIVAQAERGFGACRHRHREVLQSAQQVRVRGLGFGEVMPSDGLRVRTPHGDQLVMPLVWSSLRERFLPGLMEGSELRTGKVLWDLAACIPLAAGLWLRVVFLLLLVVCGVVLGAVLLATWGVYSVGPLHYFLNRLGFEDWAAIGVGVGAAITILGAAFALAAGFDLLGDVAAFVGRPEHRERAIAGFRDVIERLRTQAPRAEIVVVGHSLGSVLVTHALREVPAAGGRRRRHRPETAALSVVTLGSPLSWMSRVFPSVVSSPAELASTLRAAGAAVVWVNLWRDWDLIGRRLPAGEAPLVQQSLGDGPHANYWRDARLWEMLVRILAAPQLTLEAVRARIERPELYPDEASEARRSRRTHALLAANGLLGAVVAVATASAGYSVPELGAVLRGEASAALAAVWWAAATATLVGGVAAVPLVPRVATPRDTLERFRYWRRPALLLWLAWLATAAVVGWRLAALLGRLPS